MRTIGVAVALAIMVAGGQQAYAATYVMKDHKGDAYAYHDPDSPRLVRSNGATNDITSVRTTHGAKAVNVAIHLRKLPREDNTAAVEIRTSAPKHPVFYALAMRVDGYKMSLLTDEAGSSDLRCKGMRARFDGAHDVVRMHVPRRCIGSPKWVRTGAIVVQDGPKASDSAIDVAGKTVLTNKWLTRSPNLPLGPRVHVG